MTFPLVAKIALAAAGIIIGGSLALTIAFGLNLGIEFTGGSLLQVAYEEERPSLEEIRSRIQEEGISVSMVQPIGDREVVVRSRELSSEEHERIVTALGQVEERKFESIGPVIGRELRNSTLLMLVLSGFAILAYIALAFRKVAEPLRSWQFSLASVLPLLHDILVPLGLLALLGALWGLEITIPVVVALLTVFGYSINNTVVTFDRIRENLVSKTSFDLASTIKESLKQTLPRNLATSLTTILVLGSLYLFGGATLQPFALTLIIGIAAGTVSSLAFAPSLLYFLGRAQRV